MAVGFAYLPFHPVSVNGMLEPFFRNADEYLYRYVRLTTWYLSANGSQRMSRHRQTAAAKELVYQTSADHVLLFREY